MSQVTYFNELQAISNYLIHHGDLVTNYNLMSAALIPLDAQLWRMDILSLHRKWCTRNK